MPLKKTVSYCIGTIVWQWGGGVWLRKGRVRCSRKSQECTVVEIATVETYIKLNG